MSPIIEQNPDDILPDLLREQVILGKIMEDVVTKGYSERVAPYIRRSIHEGIIKWNVERKLHHNFDESVEKALLDEEVEEWKEASTELRPDLMVDALCDYYIIVVGSLAKSGYHNKNLSRHFVDNYVSALNEIPDQVTELGYHFDLAMVETLKEIDSRVGYFDSETGKWKKIETKYRANYEGCKL